MFHQQRGTETEWSSQMKLFDWRQINQAKSQSGNPALAFLLQKWDTRFSTRTSSKERWMLINRIQNLYPKWEQVIHTQTKMNTGKRSPTHKVRHLSPTLGPSVTLGACTTIRPVLMKASRHVYLATFSQVLTSHTKAWTLVHAYLKNNAIVLIKNRSVMSWMPSRDTTFYLVSSFPSTCWKVFWEESFPQFKTKFQH